MIRRLFIDIETTGLPKTKGFNKYFPYTSMKCYDTSRIVSISWIHTKDNIIDSYREVFVRPDNFIIKNSKFHGIKHKYALKHGLHIIEMFEELEELIEDTDEFLSYNIGFDLNVLSSELYRYECYNLLESLQLLKHRCVMQECFDKGHENEGKYMKLLDLHKKIFNEEFNAHNAYEDTYAAYRLFNKVIGDQ